MAKKRQTFSVPPTRRQRSSVVLQTEVLPHPPGPDVPVMFGQPPLPPGHATVICGVCGEPLLEDIDPTSAEGMIISCDACEHETRIVTGPEAVAGRA